ncbi:piggyBac transposable element-derived protein 4-like [Mytilus trossulus]|uniref:piggyBac transposable element-derived protein 4-like n=1 Tax=Mytilus trossulus TaxID=6551 RepID=UPI0030073ADA
MGIVRKPSYASYWENGNKNVLTCTPNFSQIMSRNRFQEILRFLHCNDNDLAVERGQAGYDPLHKVANIIEFFNRTFEENYRLSQNVCIDERMIGFKGRHFLNQYIANKKAHRWGVKAWVLAESGSGYTHQVELYKGKSNAPRHPDGQGYKVVMDLMRPHFGNQHHLTIDSWFTSPKLVHDLRNRGTYCTGTVIATRKGMPQSFRKAKLPKGAILAKSRGPVMSVLYSDRRQVSLLTTAGSAKMTWKPNSKGKVVKAPALVHKYNETMGGVDLGDQFIAQNEPQFRSLKLWKKILFNLLMTATVNAYICYRNTFVVQKKMNHLTFQQEIIQGLIGQHREGQTRPGRRCLLQSTRLTARHFIE